MTELPSKSHVACLIECGGVWFAAGRCGVTWKFLQGKRRKPVKLEGFCMLDDSDEEDVVESIEEAEQNEAASSQVTEDVVEESTPIKKAPRKKRVVKKANE